MKSDSTEQSVERIENGHIKKKRNRPSKHIRRSKLTSVPVEDTHVESSDGRDSSRGKAKDSTSSSKQQQMDTSNGLGVMRASNVAFNSVPPLYFERPAETGRCASPLLPSPEVSKQLLSKSCPDPRACDQSPRMDGDLFQQIKGSSQRKIFSSHWSLDAVNEALEKGEAFKALFRVNAHNRYEAYCKIDGVPTDILINGNVGQNRAVEGDIVVIKLDPLSLWPKMKGFVTESVARSEVTDSPPEKDNINARQKKSVDVVEGFEDGFSINGSPVIGQGGKNCVSRSSKPLLDSYLGSSSEQKGNGSAVEKLCGVLSSFPHKRPTGQVVAVVEKSLVRDSIVGLLDIKGWSHYKGGDAKRCKSPSSLSDDEYVQLMPADPRFPKLIVPFHALPGSIRERLENIDPTLEAELVAAQIVDWGEGSPFPVAQITHLFGRGSELEPQIKAILYQNLVCDSDFSPGSLTSLPRVPWVVPEEEVQRRKDLRDLCVLTIDPSTATDLDDALSVQSLPGGVFRVGVHIADVSYFVLPETALDIEAQFRSTSVYMLQRKISMLPPLLSENVGSLNPGADRLAFSIFWDLNREGDVIDRWIGRTVIRSCCKLSYDHAQDIIDGKSDVTDNGWPSLHGSFEWSDVVRSVKQLSEISTTLRQKRFRNGALQLENSKPVFLFDEHGVPYDFVTCSRKGSNFLVEEFMLLANMTAAEVISRAYPDSSLLRRHPEPNTRKLKEFEGFCSKHGMDLDISSSGQLQESLEKITGNLKDDSVFVDILNNYAIKPMQLASYFCTGNLKDSVAEWGHYALAVPLYTHFTSPLRRYADIVVHRAIAAALEAEELYSKQKQTSIDEVRSCFTGIHFNKDAAESMEGKEALSVAALKHGVPSTEILSDVAAYCNDRKLASRKVRDACDKLYTWFVLKRKAVFPCEARVMNLGSRFMTVYISKLGIERRIYYDQIEGLCADWLEATSTLILDKLYFKRGGRGYFKPLEEVAYVVSPSDLCAAKFSALSVHDTESSEAVTKDEVAPAVFPLTVQLFSTIPVVLHAVGGDDGPLDIGARLYMSSYYL
ncbi:PREDICTED: DIS3-like exonuclease 2 [Camelina sativa]|uniref:DIS3-like exonuclease 2 n=1 Tax=Camelina sativa TaxID=90675 RepID=A0ABM0TNA7_CAMSA|nr:PREDICTED: DIS3-like exonuclease 2 [Camelina sativa]